MKKAIFLLYLTLFCLNQNFIGCRESQPLPETPEGLYLELMKRCILDCVYKDIPDSDEWTRPTSTQEITDGQNAIRFQQSMMGFHAIDKLHELMNDVTQNNIPGDFIETGVWRGGLTIFMRAYLKAYGDKIRKVWVADSFQGVPIPNATKYPADAGINLYLFSFIAVSLEEVKRNFSRYSLLDDQVCFLKGWFSDTLPNAPIQSLSIMRLDGDLYESTMDALKSLYPKLSVGGYVIIDDYGAIDACAQAVHDFRNANNITDEILWIDWTGVYWKRTK